MSDELHFHPLADLVPNMTDEQFKELVADIKANGLRHPIILYEGKILDGRHRYMACLAAGVALRTVDGDKYFGIEDPAAYVISVNIRRRHLNAEDKQKTIERLIKARPEWSDRRVAQAAETSHPRVARVREKLEKSGDVERRSTSVDTKGRKQPARKTQRSSASPTSDKGREEISRLAYKLIRLDLDLARELLEVLNSGGGGTYLALDLKTGIDIEENGIIKAKHAEGGRAEDERPEDEDQFEDEPKKRKKKVKLVAHEATLRETVGDAFADLIELAEECRELVDNVSDSPGLSQTQRILTFDETASALENLIKPNIPTGLENIKVTYSLPKRRNGARWARASHACDIITACEEALTSIETEDAQTLRGELEEVRSQAEYLEFPGMFG